MSSNPFSVLKDLDDPPSPEFSFQKSKLDNLSGQLRAEHGEGGWDPSNPLDQLADAMGGLSAPTKPVETKLDFKTLLDTLPGVSEGLGARMDQGEVAWDFDGLVNDVEEQQRKLDRESRKIVTANDEDDWEELLDATAKVRRFQKQVGKIKAKVQGKRRSDKAENKVRNAVRV